MHPKSFLVVHVLCFLLLVTAKTKANGPSSNDPMVEMFENWIAKFNVKYSSSEEKARRLTIFTDNVNMINEMNSKGNSYTLAVNQFTDLTHDEFIKKQRLTNPMEKDGDGAPAPAPRPPPPRPPPPRPPPPPANCSSDRIDWRDSGAVNFVRDQGNCDSDWAFSAVAAIEGIWKIKKAELLQLSEQQLIDCDRNSYGCSGGWMEKAFTYAIKNKGLNNRFRYPYLERERRCRRTVAAVSVARIRSYTRLPRNNETALRIAVGKQPVSVGIDARDIWFYGGGIYTGPCDFSLNHAMTAIGYGCDASGVKFWILKNSWGTSWGESGYMRLQRDYSDPRGLCGVAKRPSYPNV